MGPVDALWHLLNLLAPGLGLGVIAAAMVKVLWRRELASVPFGRLARWGALASTVALLGGLVITGRDGRMATYAAMVVACALALWWAGFGARRR
ncbi:MAG: hypothetical protein JNL87_02715 [Burkholderiaceae bacterium]|nr:hypothetical protein [Burkholderiaceae bacterium]